MTIVKLITVFCLYFLINVANLQDAENKCERLFVRTICRKVGDDYYVFDVTKSVNWFDAHRTCRRFHGHLPTFHNYEELNRVGLAIIDAVRPERDWYWSSLNDLGTEGTFYTSDTGEAAPYVRWGKDEPNNANNNENCVHIFRDTRPGTNTSFYMNDNNCAGTMHIVCKL